MTYNVAFRTRSGTSEGAITWSTFKSNDHFLEWYDKDMKAWYEVVERGISQERAIELCSTPAARVAAALSHMRASNEMTRLLILGPDGGYHDPDLPMSSDSKSSEGGGTYF